MKSRFLLSILKHNAYKYMCMVFTLIVFHMHQASALVTIPLDDPKIYYDGVFYADIKADSVILNRHTLAAYNDPESGIYWQFYQGWRNTQSGIRIRFKTSSPTIYMQFSKRTADGNFVVPSPTNGFTVFADGVEKMTYSSLSFAISNPTPGTSVVFEVTLPNLWAVNFKGLQLEDGNVLDDPGANTQPVYAAFGTSITHGTGQYVSTARTYPFKLAKCMGWNLYNFAVAGSIVGWQLAYNIQNKHVDYISIEQGFNDWYTDYPSPLATVQGRYAKFIDTLRKFQPNAVIYCIAPITTTATKPSAPFTLQQFRDMVIGLVHDRQSAGDTKLFVIDGSLISNASMLTDGIHLNESGAATLASNLCSVMPLNQNLNPVKDQLSLSSSQIKVIHVTTYEIRLDIKMAGNYGVEIYSIDGRKLFNKEKTYFAEGTQNLNWKSSSDSLQSCLVKISGDEGYQCELKLIE